MPATTQFDPRSAYRGAQALLRTPPSPYPWGPTRRPAQQTRRVRRFSGLGALGQITAEQAAQQAMPQAVSNTPGFTQDVFNDIEQAAASGSFVGFNPTGCTGVSAGGNIKIIQQASGLALSGVSMGLTAAGVVTSAALAPFTLGISAVIGLFPLFFAHHAAAVKKEQQTVCAAVPAAQNYLEQIQNSVSTGLATPAQGIQALQSLLSDFTSQVASIMKNSSSQCNAACVWVKELTAIVAYQSAQYQEQAAQVAANPVLAVPGASLVENAIGTTSGATGIPTWVFYLGGAILLWQWL
jgi:hypothetical protein